MSAETVFWQYKPDQLCDAQSVCELLCSDVEVLELREIDVGAFLARIAAAFPKATRLDNSQISFDGRDWKFLLAWSKQHVHLTLYGTPPANDLDVISAFADELCWWSYYPSFGELYEPGSQPTIESPADTNFEASLQRAPQLFSEDEDIDKSQHVTSGGGFSVGDSVVHTTFGTGVIHQIETMQARMIAVIDFDQTGRKAILIGVAPLQRLQA